MSHFPTAPSVSAGSHEMRDHFSNDDPPRSSPYTAPSITPYLGLRSRLSQIWFNRWTVLLVVVLARMLIACTSAHNELASARSEALSACSNVEAMGSVMASMPHYMAQGVNELAASGIEKAVNALMETSTLAVTGMEELVVFVINMMYGTYLCLITLAVNGSVHSALTLLDEAQKGLNNLTSALGNDMGSAVSTFENLYNDIQQKLNTVSLGLSGTTKFPTLNLTGEIDQLNNLQLPSGLSDGIQQLNNSIPNFVNVQNLTENAIREPFELLKQVISNNLDTYTFNRSVFPVPQKEQLTFCSTGSGIDDFFNELDNTVSTGKIIYLVVLTVAAILVCIPMAYRETRRWRTMKARSRFVGSHGHDPMDVIYIASRPYTSTAAINLSKGITSDRRQTLVRWVIAYATSEAALFVLALAVGGLFSCFCQYILLKAVEKEVPILSSEVAGFADLVVDKLNNASFEWANGANQFISQTNNTINQDLFGWAQNSTLALNNTLNTFVELTSNELNTTFGGTVLYEPIKGVLNCLLLLKIEGIEKGLTWIQENAHINMPLLPNNTFSLGAAASIASGSPADQSFLASPGDVAADKIDDVVARFVNSMENQILTETIIAVCILALYVVAVLSAIIRAATLWFGHNKVRGEGGAAPNILDNPGAQSQPSIAQSSVAQIHAAANDFRSNNQDRYQMSNNIPMQAFDPPKETAHVDHGPAPRYSMAVEEYPPRNNNPFEDSKRIFSEDDFDTDNKI